MCCDFKLKAKTPLRALDTLPDQIKGVFVRAGAESGVPAGDRPIRGKLGANGNDDVTGDVICYWCERKGHIKPRCPDFLKQQKQDLQKRLDDEKRRQKSSRGRGGFGGRRYDNYNPRNNNYYGNNNSQRGDGRRRGGGRGRGRGNHNGNRQYDNDRRGKRDERDYDYTPPAQKRRNDELGNYTFDNRRGGNSEEELYRWDNREKCYKIKQKFSGMKICDWWKKRNKRCRYSGKDWKKCNYGHFCNHCGVADNHRPGDCPNASNAQIAGPNGCNSW